MVNKIEEKKEEEKLGEKEKPEDNKIVILEEMDTENVDKNAEKLREQNKNKTEDKEKDSGGICGCFIF